MALSSRVMNSSKKRDFLVFLDSISIFDDSCKDKGAFPIPHPNCSRATSRLLSLLQCISKKILAPSSLCLPIADNIKIAQYQQKSCAWFILLQLCLLCSATSDSLPSWVLLDGFSAFASSLHAPASHQPRSFFALEEQVQLCLQNLVAEELFLSQSLMSAMNF